MKHFYSSLNVWLLFLIVISLFCNHNLCGQQLSEVMFAPTQSHSEFIELLNYSDTTVNLYGYKIKYHTSGPDQIISLDSNYQLPPNQYAVILEADYDFVNGVYKEILPNETFIYILDDNTFGSSGMSNSSDRVVYLLNENDDTLDVYTYSADNEKGFSDEQTSPDNKVWKNSITLHGTPGFKNSVSPKHFDLEISAFRTSQNYVLLGESIELNVKIKNLGIRIAEMFALTISISSEKFYSSGFQNLLPNDSLEIQITLEGFSKGQNIISGIINFETDENIENNNASINIYGISINEEVGDIIINEFMSSPKSSETEWIELFNRSDKEINLKKYRIADSADTSLVVKTDYILLSKQYVVFADDSTFETVYPNLSNHVITNLHTLNNSGDQIIILDSLNRTIDSLTYGNTWNGQVGWSFERIDPYVIISDNLNWRSTIQNTPGRINSVTQKDFDLKIDSVYTIPENPLIDSLAKFIVEVKNIGKREIEYSIKVFEDTDLDSLENNLIEESPKLLINPGEINDFEFSTDVRITNSNKQFVFTLYTQDDDSTNNKSIYNLRPSYSFKSIVINEIMFSSTNYEPEWIEFYNNSGYDINIKNWKISDVVTTPVTKVIEEDYIFPSMQYLVISKSNSIYEFHRSINSNVIELKFANLNNDEDGVVLKDNNGRTIDSVKYDNSYNLVKGTSLERINVFHSSINVNNWNNSIDYEGSTPGRINSRTAKDNDLALTSISTLPRFPVKGQDIQIKVKVKNYGKKDVTNFSILYTFTSLNKEKIADEIFSLECGVGDSIIVISNQYFTINDTSSIEVKLQFENDEDEGNNFMSKFVIPGFNAKTVLINEIMFKPNSGNSEWIEIVNNSDIKVNLKNWLVGDTKQSVIITEDDFFIDPEDFVIISSERGNLELDSETKFVITDLPELSDTKDGLVIYDYRNAVIDSVYYNQSKSFNSGFSLERIDLEYDSLDELNWSFSFIEEGTPGSQNSVSLIPKQLFADVIITEIMYDPGEMNSEFIEIFNTSDQQIEIGGWKILDEDNNNTLIYNMSFYLAPLSYFVIVADSSIFGNYHWLDGNRNISILNKSFDLTNNGKRIFITDIRGNIIDSMSYSESLHNSAILETKNISLELLNTDLSRELSSNWSSSVSDYGATPGKQNSIMVQNKITKARINISPNPFSPDNDGYEDFTYINYNLKDPISQIRIRIYDSKGRLVRKLVEYDLVGSSGTIIFDGLDESKRALKIGIYIILLEAVNSNNNIVETMKEVVVVARKL